VVGKVLLDLITPWVDRYPFVGHVGGAGMFAGVELVSDKQTKQPLPRTVTARIFDECVKRGLLTMAYAPSFRIQPPLTTDEATLRNGLAIVEEVFDLVAQAGWWRP
jgi:4-aminobutyrate aminotransferase-like enzyme